MVQFGGKDGASVGIKLPNGTYERPIGKNRLVWIRPGILGLVLQIKFFRPVGGATATNTW